MTDQRGKELIDEGAEVEETVDESFLLGDGEVVEEEFAVCC